jgi:small subunit ribosomal protein S14
MRAKIERDLKRRKLVAKFNRKRTALKKILSDKSISPEMRMVAQDALQKLPRDSSPVRLNNRCMLTGRPRAVSRYFGISRIKMRELALQGRLPGVSKSSW